MPPSTAACTESIWSYLLAGIGIVFDSEESNSISAKVTECCLPQNRGHHRCVRCQTWIHAIRGWHGPSTDGMGSASGMAIACHPWIHGWHGIRVRHGHGVPSVDPWMAWPWRAIRGSMDGMAAFGARCGSRPSTDGPDQMRIIYLMQDFLPVHP